MNAVPTQKDLKVKEKFETK